MQVKDRLRDLKEIEDKNRAVDAAFLAGVQSVTPLREFTCKELYVLLEVIRIADSSIPFIASTTEKKRFLKAAFDIIASEIHRREDK